MKMQNDPSRSTGEAMSNGAAADPLLTLVRAFRAEQAHINAHDDADDAYFARLYDRLTHETPDCWTAEGASAALRLVADDLAYSTSAMHGSVLASVQAFLTTRT
jgi:hypothetical protein